MKSKNYSGKTNHLTKLILSIILMMYYSCTLISQNLTPDKVNATNGERIKVKFFDPAFSSISNCSIVPTYPLEIDEEEDTGIVKGIVTSEEIGNEFTIYYLGDDSDPQNDNFSIFKRPDICFPPRNGVPREAHPPYINGEIASDVGWTGAYRLSYDNGTNPDLVFQAVANTNGNYIYMSFEVSNDELGEDDAILICLRPKIVYSYKPTLEENLTDQAMGTRLIVIQPNNLTTCNQDAGISYYKNSDTFTLIDGGIREDSVCKISNITSRTWNVELKIPTNTTTGGPEWIDIEDNFMFYFNLCRVSSLSITVDEYKWPVNAENVSGSILTYSHYSNDFGIAHKGSAANCQGIEIANYTDIYTENTPDNEIQFDDPATNPNNDYVNKFRAKVSNNSSDPATGIYVTFKIANWGLGNDWANIPGTPNPSGPQIVNPSTLGNETIFNSEWILTNTEISQYNTPSKKHQCILAELDADPGVNIISKSRVRNMNFDVNASKFTQIANIGTFGLGNPILGKDNHQLLLNVITKEYTKVDDSQGDIMKKQQKSNNNSVLSFLDYTVHGGRYTGKKIIINNHSYDIVEPVGSYGYRVKHEGEVKKWLTKLIGAEMIKPGIYQLEIKPNSSVQVTDIIKPIEQRWSLSLHGGISIPSGNYTNNFKSGYSVMADIDYHFSNSLAIVILGGYHNFKSKTTGIDDTYWINLSANLRYYKTLGSKWSVYAGAGPGIYFPESGSAESGYNAGLGLNFEANSLLNFELGSDYHQSFNSGLKFIQNHFGIVLRF